MDTSRRLRQSFSVLWMAAAVLVTGSARADDLDIYTTPVVLPAQAPLTALALDLNLSNTGNVVCDNVLLSTSANCVQIQGSASIGEVLTLLSVPTTVLGGLNPATLISDINGAVRTILATTIGASAVLSLTEQQVFVIGLQQILTALVDTRLTIILNHNDKTTDDLLNLLDDDDICAFADSASIPGPRRDTVACSNGAYLFAGFTNLSDPLQLTALVSRVVTALVPSAVALPGQPSAFAADHPYQTKEIYAELTKYLRGDNIFNGHLGYFDYGDSNVTNNLDTSFPLLSWDAGAEASSSTYNSGLAAFPQACTINLLHLQATNAREQDDSDTDLNVLFPEADANRDGQLGVAELVTAAESTGFVFGEDRRRIRSRFIVQENLFEGGDLSDLDQLNTAGGNVSTYTDAIGLLGRGTELAASLTDTLSVNTTLTSLTIAASRSTTSGILKSAYLPVFRADPDQKPDWPGNLKRLSLRTRPVPNQKLFDVVDARDDPDEAAVPALTGEGKIRSNALTVWTNAAQLGGTANDGPVADLGGAGQKIPGYQFGGGGDPGRSNSDTGGRKIYYDSLLGAGMTLCGAMSSTANSCGKLNPDDAAVRAELQAATGATPYIAPGSICASTCNSTFSGCGLLCDTNQATCNNGCSLTQTSCNTDCATTQTLCGTGCTTNQTTCTTGCAVTATTCNLTCLPGALGNACRASCTANQNTCNTGCNNTATSCNTTCTNNFNTCGGNCSSGFNTCTGNCTSSAVTCNGNCNNSLTGCLLGCGNGVDRTADTVTRELLLHARGFDVGTRADPEGNGPLSSPANSGVTGRPWLLGAVLHSRPLAINYGKRNGPTNPEVVRVVYGSADGILHMTDDATGVEKWGFMPQAVMGNISVLRENQAGATLPYGVDGSPVLLIRDRTGSNINSVGDGIISSTSSEHDRALLIFGLRRGGAAYYALDVTEPDEPQLLWKLSTDGLHRAGEAAVVSGSAAQFATLGLAFSTPQVARIRYDANGLVDTPNTDITTRSALIFGGGYNGGRNAIGTKLGKDFNNSRNIVPLMRVGMDDGTAVAERGNAMFMIDAATGELLWRAERSTTAVASFDAASRTYRHPMLVDSLPSDLTVIDANNDTFNDRFYIGDTGGRLWRGDFAGAYPSAWTITPIASVGRHNSGSNTLADDRRIFFAPDFVPIRNNQQGIDLVLFGTGDREDPLNLTTENWFYAVRDTDLVSGKLASEIIVEESDTDLPKHASFDDFTSVTVSDIASLTHGYKFNYTRTGEKHFSSPVTLGGVTTFTSYVPPDPSDPTRVCTPGEGASRLFSISVRTSKFVNLGTSSSGRDVPLGTGLPGEINTLAGTQQAAGGQVYAIPAKDTYRASWRERIGETQK